MTRRQRHILDVLTVRRDFLRRLTSKRQAEGLPADREADEASVLTEVIQILQEMWESTIIAS